MPVTSRDITSQRPSAATAAERIAAWRTKPWTELEAMMIPDVVGQVRADVLPDATVKVRISGNWRDHFEAAGR